MAASLSVLPQIKHLSELHVVLLFVVIAFSPNNADGIPLMLHLSLYNFKMMHVRPSIELFLGNFYLCHRIVGLADSNVWST